MSVEIRVVRRKDRFVQVPNSTIRDKRLSFRARGLLAYVLSLPDQAPRDSRSIAQNCTEGRDAVLAAIKELGECGYFHKRTVRAQGGKLSQQIAYCESPDLDPWEEFDEPGSGFQTPVDQTPVGRAPVDQDVKEEDGVEDGLEDKTLSPPKSEEADPVASGIAQLMACHLSDLGLMTRSMKPSGWANDIGLMIRLDGVEPDGLPDFLAWLYTDEQSRTARFWRTNVRSGTKLREHYATIVARRRIEEEDAERARQRETERRNQRPAWDQRDVRVSFEESRHPASGNHARKLPDWIWTIDLGDDPIYELTQHAEAHGFTLEEALAAGGKTIDEFRATA